MNWVPTRNAAHLPRARFSSVCCSAWRTQEARRRRARMAHPGEPVQLWTTKAERDKYDNFADLFAIIKTVEKLEKARDS